MHVSNLHYKNSVAPCSSLLKTHKYQTLKQRIHADAIMQLRNLACICISINNEYILMRFLKINSKSGQETIAGLASAGTDISLHHVNQLHDQLHIY